MSASEAEAGRRTILLLGRQGAGKGLIGRLLANRLDADFLSMGDVLRAEEARGTDLGREIGALIDAGNGVPPEVSYSLMADAVATGAYDRRLVLDGVPRRTNETGRVRELLGGEPWAVVVLDVPPPLAVQRLLSRQSCRRCGMPHGPGWPPQKGRCRQCGDVVGARPDDAEFARIRRRLMVWRVESREIMRHYRRLGVAREVAADGAVLEVLERVVSALAVPAG